MTPWQAAAAVAATFPAGSPEAQLARDRLNVLVEAERNTMTIQEPTVVGTPLRDAAVDPSPHDIGPAGAAGEADPHGPRVWNATVGTAEYHRQVELARSGEAIR